MSDDAAGSATAERGLQGAANEVASFEEEHRGPIWHLQAFLHSYPTTIPLIVLLVGVVIFSIAAPGKFLSPLNLSVVQQTTNSLRTVIGAQLGGAMDLGWREKLAMQLRLGWSHEYADVGRPVTAALAGAPAMPFTTFGISPQRDGVVIGLSANTAIAEATSIYLRYEGDISAQDSAHAITAGVRMVW